MDGSIEEATDIGANSQQGTHTCCHGGGVMKRSTDSCMVVMDHAGQDVELDRAKPTKNWAAHPL